MNKLRVHYAAIFLTEFPSPVYTWAKVTLLKSPKVYINENALVLSIKVHL